MAEGNAFYWRQYTFFSSLCRLKGAIGRFKDCEKWKHSHILESLSVMASDIKMVRCIENRATHNKRDWPRQKDSEVSKWTKRQHIKWSSTWVKIFWTETTIHMQSVWPTEAFVLTMKNWLKHYHNTIVHCYWFGPMCKVNTLLIALSRIKYRRHYTEQRNSIHLQDTNWCEREPQCIILVIWVNIFQTEITICLIKTIGEFLLVKICKDLIKFQQEQSKFVCL